MDCTCIRHSLHLRLRYNKEAGGRLIKKDGLTRYGDPMLKIRRPNGRLIFNMEIAIRR